MCNPPSHAHTKLCPLVKCNIKQDIQQESSKRLYLVIQFWVVSYPLLLLFVLIEAPMCCLYYFIFPLLTFWLLFLFFSSRTESSGFWLAKKVTPFIVIQLFDCCDHLLDDFATSGLAWEPPMGEAGRADFFRFRLGKILWLLSYSRMNVEGYCPLDSASLK